MINWKGRTDGTDSSQLRWHQIVQTADNIENFQQDFVLIGFCSDKGVERNKGRVGAQEAPNVLRNVMANFPAHHRQVLWDAGNIQNPEDELEVLQEKLTEALLHIYQNNGKSLVLGGGHEVTFPHFQALRKFYPDKKIGIINFDAHFDNRPLETATGASSGTGFYQIAQQETLQSLHIGISENSNTQALFNFAEAHAMQYILREDWVPGNESVIIQIEDFIQSVQYLYVTVCMDVFSAAFAPGVSATAYNGIIPDIFFQKIFKNIVKNPKLKAFDVAEINPSLDIDHRTSKLAASFIYTLLQ